MFRLLKKKENEDIIKNHNDSMNCELLVSRLQDLFANCLKVIEHDAHQLTFGGLLSKENKEYQSIYDYYGGKLTSDVLFAKMLCNIMGWNCKEIEKAIERGKNKALEEFNTGCDIKELLSIDEILQKGDKKEQ